MNHVIMFKKKALKIFIAICIFFASIFLVFAIWLGASKVKAGAGDNVIGWAWSGYFGWLSFNSTNETAPSSNYGVSVDSSTGSMNGYAYAVNLVGPDSNKGGYIDFSNASYNKETGQVTGSAYIVGRPADEGKIQLIGSEVSPTVSSYVACYDCEDVCTASQEEIDGNGGECPPGKSDKKCRICFTQKDPLAYCETGCGNICFACGSCSEPSTGEFKCDNCNNCYKYGVGITQTGQWVGWGWNGLDTDGNLEPDAGYGWISFSNVQYGAVPWVEVLNGSVYSGGDIIADKEPPPSRYNVMYLIHANGKTIQNFTCEKEGCQKTNFGDLKFPKLANKYINALGKIDLDGILSGKYGAVENFTDVNDLKKAPLDGKVYHYIGDLTIENPLNFKNGTGQQNGAGLVVVDGNLNIKANITYDDQKIQNFKNLASIGWIIKGDLKINHNVKEIAGAFIVLGKDNAVSCPDLTSFDTNGCGRIDTGTIKDTDPNSSDNFNLKVKGLLMAKQFRFARQYANVLEGSEVIINDGRLSVNTPPGLADLTKALPVFRPSAP